MHFWRDEASSVRSGKLKARKATRVSRHQFAITSAYRYRYRRNVDESGLELDLAGEASVERELSPRDEWNRGPRAGLEP
jgi:hypothetical protein